MKRLSILRLCSILLLSVFLTACESAQEQAEAYFQSASALYEEGDPDRAMVELRNAMDLDENHQQARALMAQIFLDRGEPGPAYGQFLRLAEQAPDVAGYRVALAELAFENRDFEEFTRHGTAARDLAPDEPRVQAVGLGLRFQIASEARDLTELRAIGQAASQLRATLPDNAILPIVILNAHLMNGEFAQALDLIDQRIAAQPRNRGIYRLRITVLERMGDMAGVETALVDLTEQFPGDPDIQRSVMRFYIDRDRLDSAEAFLRGIADPAAASPDSYINLISFLDRFQGPQAARAELDRGLELNPGSIALRALRAGMVFDTGERAVAIAEMEDILADAEPNAQSASIKIDLARMLASQNNQVGAQARIAEVLAQDPTRPEALKMQANWQVQADQPDAAIATLRQVLEGAPRDDAALTLMATAYLRAGNPDLARDFMAQAATASGYGAAPSLRYARVLIEQEKYLPAEDVLIPALRRAPDDADLMSTLGRVYLATEDQPRLTQVIGSLRRMQTPRAGQAANALEAEQLNRRGGVQEALAYLEALAGSQDADQTTRLGLLRARMSTGDTDGALSLAQELLAQDPADPTLRFALAVAQSAAGDLPGAETALRNLLKEDAGRSRLWTELARNLQRQGKGDAARATVAEALATLPFDPTLLWAQASFMERDNDIDGAIAIYERLYEQDTGNLLIANNLASLLASYREDAESLERAYQIARRMAGTTVPAMADTYGWILTRRGAPAEAMSYLEIAAAGIADPLVAIHLGLTYAALDQVDTAISQLQSALDMAGPGDTRPQIAAAAAKLQQLRASRNE